MDWYPYLRTVATLHLTSYLQNSRLTIWLTCTYTSKRKRKPNLKKIKIYNNIWRGTRVHKFSKICSNNKDVNQWSKKLCSKWGFSECTRISNQFPIIPLNVNEYTVRLFDWVITKDIAYLYRLRSNQLLAENIYSKLKGLRSTYETFRSIMTTLNSQMV